MQIFEKMNKWVSFSYPKDHSTKKNIVFFKQSKGVLCSPRTDNTKDNFSGFQAFFIQPIVKDQSENQVPSVQKQVPSQKAKILDAYHVLKLTIVN